METIAFRNPRYPGRRIIVTANGDVLDSRTRQRLDHVDNPKGAAFWEFRELVKRLANNKPLVRPQHKER